MGVPKEVFINLEINMILHHFNSLMDEKEAAKLLTESLSPVFPFITLHKSGITLTNEPFFRSLLLAYFKSFAGIYLHEIFLFLVLNCCGFLALFLNKEFVL